MFIGNLEIKSKYPLLLAPMEDVTEPSFRYLCKQYGVDLMYTEFVASEALIRNVEKSFKKLTVLDYERPVGIQIYGHQIDSMVEAAKIAARAKPELIDINFGCPVKKIATRGAGAGMLRDITKMIKMTAEIVKAVDLPVTVKTRLGWDTDSIVIEEVAERLQDVGIKALTIHGRTRSQFYKGVSDWTLIGKIKNKNNIKIPIIGNGDVDSPQRAKEMFDKYGVDAIMIGRASIGRPYIFKEIKHYLNTGELLNEPTIEEKVELAKNHLLKSLEWKGSPRGIYEMRRQYIQYFKGLPNFKDLRMTLVTSVEIDEILSVLEKIKLIYK
ncbi:MAG: tRNA dihydrouridine synthase DusB [Bacteroidales bacterium]|nr:tRNA dihydrouridine synthase DusB [Bacteroidales bacterium]